jgi:hypothetical protein
VGSSNSYAFGDCVYVRNTIQTTPFMAGEAVSGSFTLTLASGSFDNNLTLDLVSGFNNTTSDWVRLEASTTASYVPVPEPADAAAIGGLGTLAALCFIRRKK